MAEESRLLNSQGVALAVSGKYAEATALLRRAREFAPSYASPLLSLASISREEGRPAESLALCEEGLANLPGKNDYSRDEDFHALLDCKIYSYRELGRLAEAEAVRKQQRELIYSQPAR
jgi:tetratricopeptide (TPR) repeat protein